ncbi:peptidoglycan amidohydrolase family protein [Enterococcus sp. BWR-S5]|uniref:peptidoglycan amidohydrolase family protein n=1 Tax=Enterococcus sp. BWR-S5 TaxID=2787714 RepID=UPI0019236B02|nr:peptidoglycan amidohydrolase family protein [Enterococcus sp. BWR-S5]MBL1226248.1 hypothetical protein [Enterococcus sp. BWR-S5]
MANIEVMINWFQTRIGKSYNTNYPERLGPNSYDCSSAVFYSLIEAGFLPKGTAIGNTESLYHLEGSLLTPISRSQVQRGDIFVAGKKGGSSGAGGHTGVFVSNSRIIHCYYPNGIGETPATGYMGDGQGLPVYYYRLKGGKTLTATIDSLNLNCSSYSLSGWMVSSDGDLSKKALNIYYMDATTGRELARQTNVEWKQRTDVKNSLKLSYDKVGFAFTAPTPGALLGKTFRILVRAGASSEGYEKLFDKKHSLIAAFNTGSLDKAIISGNKLTLGGWHACNDITSKTGHLLILMEGSSEVFRQDVTADFVIRDDVQSSLGNQAYGANKSGFMKAMIIPTNLKGKKVRVLSKRIGGPNASANITFDKLITL